MAAKKRVQVRVDSTIKKEAADILSAMGLTVSDAVSLLLTRVAQERALPFEPLIPNATTIQATKDARTGKVEPVAIEASRDSIMSASSGRPPCTKVNADHYTYSVTWSPEDGEHVGLCTEFPWLSWLDKTPEATLKGIRHAVMDVVADMRAKGERAPVPLTPSPACAVKSCSAATTRHNMQSKKL